MWYLTLVIGEQIRKHFGQRVFILEARLEVSRKGEELHNFKSTTSIQTLVLLKINSIINISTYLGVENPVGERHCGTPRARREENRVNPILFLFYIVEKLLFSSHPFITVRLSI